MLLGPLAFTCSDGARSAASYRGLGLGSLTVGGGRDSLGVWGSPGGLRPALTGAGYSQSALCLSEIRQLSERAIKIYKPCGFRM